MYSLILVNVVSNVPFSVCVLLRQRERWFIVHELHLATSESRTSPECHRSRAKGQQNCFGCNEVVKSLGGLCVQMVRFQAH